MLVRLILWFAVTGASAWWLPWWATLAIALAGLWLVFRPYRNPMQEGVDLSRGFVLREAVVKVDGLSFEPIDPDTRRLRLDLTVRPRPGNSRVKPWLPREFRFVPDVGNEVRAGTIEERAGKDWKPSTRETLTGEQRVRLQLVVAARATRLTIKYFLEDVAQVDLKQAPPA